MVESDEALLVRARTDRAAFAEFYRRTVDLVTGYAVKRCGRPEDVADLVAATYLAVLESAGRYDPRPGRRARLAAGR